MKAIILAAGIGKRMQPIQKDKCLMKFLGKELILNQIETLEEVGIKEFIIICNPRSMEKVKELVGSKAEYAVQQEAKGMGDALLSIENPPKEALIVQISDLLEHNGYEKVLTKKEGDAVILGYKVKEYFPGGYLVTDNERIKKIIEKPGAGNEPSDLINIVVHLHRKFDKFLEYIKSTKSEKDDVYECAMSKMMEDGYDFRYVIYDRKWVPIKYPWHILDVMKFFLERIDRKISNSAEISSNATISGNVVIEDSVKILENAAIKGPCYIGKNSVIGTNALIRNYSHIGDNCIVGYSTEITNSWIDDNCWFHTDYIGDSIIGDNCSFGSGAVTANFRFDGKTIKVMIGENDVDSGRDKLGIIIGENCQVGVNATLLPGKKLGHNSIVGPGVCLQDNLEANKIIFVDRKSYVIKENEIIASSNKKHELMKKLIK